MKNDEVVGWVATGITGATSVGSTMAYNDMVALILGVIGIISAIISVGYTCYKWYYKAKDINSKGGESITKEEIKEIVGKVSEGVKDVVDKVNDLSEGGNKHDKHQ